MRHVRRLSLPVLLVGLATASGAQTRPDSLAPLLSTAASYLRDYEQKLGTLAAKELYLQKNGATLRVLRSDLLFIRDDVYGWVEYRDVLEVDGLEVRHREGRVMDLFAKPHPDHAKQAQRIVAEGARFNLNQDGAGGGRTINYPLTALRFLRGPDQYRSRFTLLDERPDSEGRVTVQFQERAMPRLIRTDDDAPAVGRFVVDAASGRVLTCELSLPTKHVTANIEVTFALDRRLGLWLPRTMRERYIGPGGLTGQAEYSDYRQFRVDTSTDIGKD